MNCVANVAKGLIPRFYIFQGERTKDDYITNLEHVWQSKPKHG
jgi:hypothetical protein